MEQEQRKGVRMVFILVVSAIFCAVAAFIALSLISDKPDSIDADRPIQGQEIIVDGLSIELHPDPEKAVILGSEPDSLSLESQPLEEQSGTSAAEASVIEQAPGPATPPSENNPPEPIVFIDYFVQHGDTLYSISSAQNSSIELLASYGIDANDLIAGNLIQIPIANPAYCPVGSPYVVRDHDTIFGIARTFNVTTEAIMVLNGFSEGQVIRITEVICVPSA